MKVLIACDSFKGSCDAAAIAEACTRGIHKADPEIKVQSVMLADGGEGTLNCLTNQDTQRITIETVDALMRPISAEIGISKNKAILEMAQANGITLLKKDELNPLITSSYGCGLLIKKGLDEGCSQFIIGLGGSATNDAGAGMLQALGARLLDKEGSELLPGGADLMRLQEIDLSQFDARVASAQFVIANDVSNLLCGKEGASAVFGPQKGAKGKDIEMLDHSLSHFQSVLSQSMLSAAENCPGDGAAGGMGFTLRTVFGGIPMSGVELMIRELGIEAEIKNCDAVITGEGRFDSQTLQGKAPLGIASLAKKYNKKCIGITGCLPESSEAFYQAGFTALFSILPKPLSLEESMETAPQNIEIIIENVFRWIL